MTATPYNDLRKITPSKTSNKSEFWRSSEPFKQIEEANFLSYKWQAKHTIFGLAAIKNFLQSVASDDFKV